MHDDAVGVPASTASPGWSSSDQPGPGRSEDDQVAAARDWLRRHGVDPGDDPQAGRAAGSGRKGRARGPATGTRAEPRSGEALEADAEPDDEGDTSPRGGRRRGRSPAEGARPGGGADGDDPDADPEEVARQIVLRKLAVQARTRSELAKALKGKAVPEEAATAVLDRMGEVGLVDDEAFARDWVSSRQQRRHLSRTALRRELQTKGVDRDVIDEALADVAGADEHRAALDLARRRSATMAALPRDVAYRRLGGVLARRGFSASTTAQVLAEVLGGWTEDGADD